MRVIALVASYNEELFIQSCIENFNAHGVEVYLIDNDSTDRTLEIASRYVKNGVIALERFPRDGVYQWEPILRRKEQLASELRADWYIHADPDEIRLPPSDFATLAEALREVDRAGFTAVNFKNFLYLPTVEAPDHEHTRFAETMLWYRYMEPSYPNQIKAWKQPQRSRAGWLSGILFPASGRHEGPSTQVRLAHTGGHKVEFDGLNLYPTDFIMKHYQVLSLRHAVRKYVQKEYAAEEVARGWHGWKAIAQENNLRLPHQTEMRQFISNDLLDTSDPIKRTLLFAE